MGSLISSKNSAIIMENTSLVLLDGFFLYDNYFAGITVAYSAPNRHGCLKVVDNNYCASRRGMISSLSMVFPVCYALRVCYHYCSVSSILEIDLFLCFLWITYRWCSLSVHLKPYLCYHLWSSCLVSWFKPLDNDEQLL